MVKGILGGNLQHHISQALELGVPLVILPISRAHGLQVADLYAFVKPQHVGREGAGVGNWDKLVSILFLFIVQRIYCHHWVCLMMVLIGFLNALIHFDAWRFTLISVVHRHGHKCFPITSTAWTGVLNTFNGLQVFMYSRWALLIGICCEIFGVIIEVWESFLCTREVSFFFCSQDVSTSIPVDTVTGSLPPGGSVAAV